MVLFLSMEVFEFFPSQYAFLSGYQKLRQVDFIEEAESQQKDKSCQLTAFKNGCLGNQLFNYVALYVTSKFYEGVRVCTSEVNTRVDTILASSKTCWQ